MKKLLLVSCLVAGHLLALPVQAQFAKAEDAIKYRKASYTLMAAHFGRLGAMVQGKVPFDPKGAADSAEVLALVSRLPYAAFVEGSDKGETRAKPEIWSESGKFREAADKNMAEVGKVVAAARTGNLDTLKAAFGSAAPTCKACHDHFRKD